MSNRATAMMQAGLAALHASGLASLAAPWTRGEGVIFTLHSVHPEPPAAFDPNGVLRITPDFLEVAVETVRKAGYETVSLDEMATRLKSPGRGRPFACFTLDDGYRDNREHAYPVFKKHGVPFAIYVPAAYADGNGDLWWYALEGALRKADRLAITLADERFAYDLTSPAQKTRAFHEIYWTLRDRPEPELRAGVRAIGEAAGYDATTLCRDLIMDWDEIRLFAADPLLTVGAHTVNHLAVAKLPDADARSEMAGSVARIERELDRPCRHFSFPYGDKTSCGPRDFAIAEALGLETAVTTHKDVVRTSYPMAGLPRVSLNGHFQEARYLEAMLSGLPFRLFDAGSAAVRALRGPSRAGRRPTAPPEAARHPDAAST